MRARQRVGQADAQETKKKLTTKPIENIVFNNSDGAMPMHGEYKVWVKALAPLVDLCRFDAAVAWARLRAGAEGPHRASRFIGGAACHMRHDVVDIAPPARQIGIGMLTSPGVLPA